MLLRNIITKCKIQNINFYNFNKINFMMDIITSFIVIMYLDKYEKNSIYPI